MNNPDPNFTTTISVDQSPEEAFAAINNVRGWWGENIEGSTANLGDEWTYRYKDMHIHQWMPGADVVFVRCCRHSDPAWAHRHCLRGSVGHGVVAGFHECSQSRTSSSAQCTGV